MDLTRFLCWVAASLMLGAAFMAGWLLGRDVISPWINCPTEEVSRD